jgi:ClpP class serine protease
VREGRKSKTISDDVMQGQSFSADMALQHGLIDQIADFAGALRDAQAMAKQYTAKRKAV